jgi:hypothetical protein
MNKEQTYFKTLVFAIQTIDSHGGQKEISKLRRVLDCVLNYEKDFDKALSIAENESENNERIKNKNLLNSQVENLLNDHFNETFK